MWLAVVCVCVSVCLKHVCVPFVMYCDVGWCVAVCECVCLSLCAVVV